MKKEKRGVYGKGRFRDRGTSWNIEFNGESKSFPKKDHPIKSAARELAEAWIKERKDAAKQEEAKKNEDYVSVKSLLEKWCKIQVDQKRSQAETAVPIVEAHMIPALGEYNARTISVGNAEAYRDKRSKQPTYKGTLPRNRTLNVEMTYLNGALKLLRPEPRFLIIPPLPLEADSVRNGTLTEELYHEFMRELPDYQKPLWCFAYYTGIRQGALRKIERAMAKDWEKAGGILVHPFSERERVMKNGDPIFVPLYMPEMKFFVEEAFRRGDQKCPYLFQKDGEQISKGGFYHTYKLVAERMGVRETLFHDTRRTAVCSMKAAGFEDDEVMAIAGIKTKAIFNRYWVVKAEVKRKQNLSLGERMRKHFEQVRSDSGQIADTAKLPVVNDHSLIISKPN